MSLSVMAQLPETKLMLFDMQRHGKTFNLLNPHALNAGSHYTNQPYFSPDGDDLFFVSSVDSTNTEIYRYDLNRHKLHRLTRTHEPEYSPRYTPGLDGISAVVVEKDKTTQHFYVFNRKCRKGKVLLPQVSTVGYYDWVTEAELLTFELPEPFYLVRHLLMQNRSDTLAAHIGRTFYYVRNKNRIVYIDKSDSLHWQLRTVAPDNLRISRLKKGPVENPVLTDIFQGEEDYCFMQDGSLLMGHEGKIWMKKNPFQHPDSKWELLADLHAFGIETFYRLAVSPDYQHLAIIAYTGIKP